MFLVLVVLSSCILIPRTSLAVDSSSYPTRAQLNSAVKLARCRAHCIDEFAYRFVSTDQDIDLKNEQCVADTNCWMCWDYCQMFNTDYAAWKNMCNQRILCFEGCLVVCAFFTSNSDSDLGPYQSDQWSFPSWPTLEMDTTEGWLRLRWPKIVPLAVLVPPLPRIVYIVFWKPDHTKPWIQLEQTISTRYETRHGDIVISGNEGKFLILAVTREGMATSAIIAKEDTTTSVFNFTTPNPSNALNLMVDEDEKQDAKVYLVIAIVGSSLLASFLFSLGLLLLYRTIQAQSRRHFLARGYAVRFRVRSQNRKRHTSTSSRSALVIKLDPGKLDEVMRSHQERTHNPVLSRDHSRYEDLFKGTIFESPPACSNRDQECPRFGFFSDRFHFSDTPSIEI